MASHAARPSVGPRSLVSRSTSQVGYDSRTASRSRPVRAPSPASSLGNATEVDARAEAAPLAEPQARELALGGLDRHPLAQIQHHQLELVAQHRRQLAIEARQRVDDGIQTTVHADEPVHRLGDPPPSTAG